MFRAYSRSLSEVLDLIGSALSVSSDVRNHRPARAADLRRLGIDPEQFGRINRR